MKKDQIDLGFVPQHFDAGTHMCLIYKNDEERIQIINKYLQSGLADGEKVGYFAMKATREDIVQQLKAYGIEVDTTHLDVQSAVQTYCPHNHFEPEQMLDSLRNYYMNARANGYAHCRVTGEMQWALEPIPGTERLMEYESQVNELVKTHPVTAICQYDARKFSGETIVDCMKVHPYMIINGQVVENPFYVQPSEFLTQYSK